MNEELLFAAALERSSPAEREAFLQQACGADDALRARLAGLLHAHDHPDTFLHAPTACLDTADAVGSTIGPYKLLEQIGEGGMGLVYMAEQQRPVRRLVALKLIKPGMDGKQVVARFESERQALALMDHPNIAKVLDAGTTDSGRPYFAMELVHGIPLNEFCDEKRLPVRQRLTLLVQVCQAVQHAHQKGIIHRDLKPTNVLVTMADAVPVPKIIDFGIAKALGQSLTEHTLHTGFTQLIGTPLYMSPEQAEMNLFGVDTRSDVYALGVMLYELLTGTTPFAKETLTEAGLDEIRRIIREEEPPRPSSRVSTLGAQALSTVSHRRRVDERHLTRVLRGELDWIVMRALEKDRTRRYESASALGADLQRYLADEPVQACPPSAAYRFRKFAWKNRAALTTVSLVVTTLVLAAAAACTVGWRQMKQQAAIERQVELALQEAELFERESKWTSALVAVKRAESLLASFVASDALHRRSRNLRQDIDTAFALEEIRLRSTGIRDGKGYDGDQFLVDEAIADFFSTFQGAGIELNSLEPSRAGQLIGASSIRGELIAALDHLARLLTGGEPHKRTWAHLLQVAREADSNEFRNQVRLAVEQGDASALKALAHADQAKDLAPGTLDLLADALRWFGDKQEAVALLREAQRRHPGDFWINGDLARILGGNEKLRFHSAALAARPQSPDAHINVAYTLMELKRFNEAFPMMHDGIRLQPEYAHAHNVLGQCLQSAGSWDEAVAAYREAMRIKPGHAAAVNLAKLYLSCPDQSFRNPALAVELLQENIKLRPTSHTLWRLLGIAQYRAGDWRGSVAALERTMQLNGGGDSFDWFCLSMAHWQLGNHAEALKWYDEAVEWAEKNKPADAELLRWRAEAAALLKLQAQHFDQQDQSELAELPTTKSKPPPNTKERGPP